MLQYFHGESIINPVSIPYSILGDVDINRLLFNVLNEHANGDMAVVLVPFVSMQRKYMSALDNDSKKKKHQLKTDRQIPDTMDCRGGGCRGNGWCNRRGGGGRSRSSSLGQLCNLLVIFANPARQSSLFGTENTASLQSNSGSLIILKVECGDTVQEITRLGTCGEIVLVDRSRVCDICLTLYEVEPLPQQIPLQVFP